jgi:ABC-type Fe3+ transport system permease subunit
MALFQCSDATGAAMTNQQMRTHRRRRATRLVAPHQQATAPMRRLENIGGFTVACAVVLLIIGLLLAF